MRNLARLFRPQSVAVIGGGAWCAAVVGQLRDSGYAGAIWPVHPSAATVGEAAAVPSVAALPAAPDAAFIGVNRLATVDVVSALSQMGAGGAVCFASGFAEVEDGRAVHDNLLAAAGDMPILGPNCYGFINACDGAMLWPDQHGCVRCDNGVAILTQSSNIAINLTMNGRGLPISFVVTAGNQAQTTQPQIASALLDDPRVTAIGLHVEGFGDLAGWQALARRARARGIPLVVLKVGRSGAAQAAAVSHTASLAGSEAGSEALLARLGIARVDDLPTFLETLKLMHLTRGLPHGQIGSISCSGGEASLIADMAEGLPVTFPPLGQRQRSDLSAALGPRVALANPLDYHTYIWRDVPAMTRAFAAMADPELALILVIVDFPRADRCDPKDWECAIQAVIGARQTTGGRFAMVATLPELMPEGVSERLISAGIIPFSGLGEALRAIAATILRPADDLDRDLLPPHTQTATRSLDEAAAKSALEGHGLIVPRRIPAATAEAAGAAADSIGGAVVLKGMGFDHKTEAGAVRLNLRGGDEVAEAARKMKAREFLVEAMVPEALAELLIGVVHDPAHGFVLTLGAGGTLTEILQDSCSRLVPCRTDTVREMLETLRIAPLLHGYRGNPAADTDAIVAAVMAVQSYVLANAADLAEVEVNPLLCTPTAAIAVDALIRTKS